MNMMAINLDWFLTIPGMLISGGVLLLLIALIIFIVTNIKSKKEPKEDIEEVTPVTEEANAQTEMPQVEPTPVVETPAVAEAPVEETPVVAPNVVNDVPPIPEVADIPVAVEPVVTNDTEEDHRFDRIVDTLVDQNKTETPSSDQVPSMEPTPVTSEPDNGPLEMPEATNLEKTSVSIYGGANPFVAPKVEENHHRPIYGGADPLEATMKMAPIAPTPVEPAVSPIVEEATLTEPVVELSTPTDTKAVMDQAPSYTVADSFPEIAEPAIPEVKIDEPTPVEPAVEPVPVETTEKIEEL